MREEIAIKISTSPKEEVDLSDMKIQDDEMDEIASKIKELRPEVETIFLNNNEIGNKGGKAMARAFADLAKLSFLGLQFNQLDKESIAAILTLKSTHPDIIFALHGNSVASTSDMLKMTEENDHSRLKF